MQKIPDDWTFEEFLAFAMLYAASIDMVITEEEEALIRQNIDEERYRAVKAIFDHCNDVQCIDVLLAYRDRYLSTPEARQEVLRHMREVFESDHRYSTLEQNVLHIFERIV